MTQPLNTLARACDVSRWHTVNTTKKQSLAEHHWMVLMIVSSLASAIGFPMSDRLMWDALLHDIDEVWKGDTPAPRKDASYGAGHTTVPYESDTEAIIKVADAIEAAWWIQNNGQGVYTSDFVVPNCVARMHRRIRQAADQYFGEEFVGLANNVYGQLWP